MAGSVLNIPNSVIDIRNVLFLAFIMLRVFNKSGLKIESSYDSATFSLKMRFYDDCGKGYDYVKVCTQICSVSIRRKRSLVFQMDESIHR